MYKNKQNISKDNARKCKGRLPEDVVQYYRRVSTELGQEFEDDEDNGNACFSSILLLSLI